MKSCGVIVEYNPFHNGHLYHLEQAKKTTNCDVLIAVMSGNFLQRGEPALFDKWTRAEMALNHGADLVIELPVQFSVQSADYFAKGGVALLQALNCDSLCFGSEEGTGGDFKRFAHQVEAKQAVIDEAFQSFKNNGSSYPVQMNQAIKSVLPTHSIDLMQPNNMLGFSYAKEILKAQSSMEIKTVKRHLAQFHDESIEEKTIASATAIRKELFNPSDSFEEIQKVVPEDVFQFISTTEYVDWENYWEFLKYRVTTMSLSDLRGIYQVNEGLEFRLKEKVKEAFDFNEFIQLIKSKRLTWVKIQRLCCYILLNLTKVEMAEKVKQVEAIRVLGFTKKGQEYLKIKKKQLEIPLITNINQKNQHLVDLDIRAGFVYQMGKTDQKINQDYRRYPIRKK
ncbi:nucleotidyltransferase [Carnobacterium divergens]|uniref:nucleotidyltransferase n=1 Tax=Carnobacterium divergens TaxID=2748 RepID=UPI0039AF3932